MVRCSEVVGGGGHFKIGHCCMSIDLKARIRQFYEAVSIGNIDAFAELIDEDIDFATNAPVDIFPHLGPCRGKAEVIKVLQQVHNDLEAITFRPLSLIVEGNAASALASVQATQRDTGSSVRHFAAHFFQFRNGLIVEYRSITDTFEAVKQVFGNAFDD
jgi:ketosteroid isomerase-like protein